MGGSGDDDAGATPEGGARRRIPSFPPTNRAVDLVGPEGALEALLEEPPADLVAAAVVCHPHPLHGGTMHNKVVYRMARGALAAGVAALRFNFRGVGRSRGSHDGGRGEQEDVKAALDFVARRFPQVPLLAAGFSFGAGVALRAGVADPRVRALVAAGTPLSRTSFDFLRRDHRPVLFLHGEQDEFGPLEEVRALARELGPRARLVVVEGVGHFFAGQLERVKEEVCQFCQRNFSAGGTRPHHP
ncbi:MAG: alpha/beta hydrolase [Acidobacteriota bacterium]